MRIASVCAIDDGRLIESGTHAELIAKDGLYAKLHALQASTKTDE